MDDWDSIIERELSDLDETQLEIEDEEVVEENYNDEFDDSAYEKTLEKYFSALKFREQTSNAFFVNIDITSNTNKDSSLKEKLEGLENEEALQLRSKVLDDLKIEDVETELCDEEKNCIEEEERGMESIILGKKHQLKDSQFRDLNDICDNGQLKNVEDLITRSEKREKELSFIKFKTENVKISSNKNEKKISQIEKDTMEALNKDINEEKQRLHQLQKEAKDRLVELRTNAAIKIQKNFKRFSALKRYGDELMCRREARMLAARRKQERELTKEAENSIADDLSRNSEDISPDGCSVDENSAVSNTNENQSKLSSEKVEKVVGDNQCVDTQLICSDAISVLKDNNAVKNPEDNIIYLKQKCSCISGYEDENICNESKNLGTLDNNIKHACQTDVLICKKETLIEDNNSPKPDSTTESIPNNATSVKAESNSTKNHKTLVKDRGKFTNELPVTKLEAPGVDCDKPYKDHKILVDSHPLNIQSTYKDHNISVKDGIESAKYNAESSDKNREKSERDYDISVKDVIKSSKNIDYSSGKDYTKSDHEISVKIGIKLAKSKEDSSFTNRQKSVKDHHKSVKDGIESVKSDESLSVTNHETLCRDYNKSDKDDITSVKDISVTNRETLIKHSETMVRDLEVLDVEITSIKNCETPVKECNVNWQESKQNSDIQFQTELHQDIKTPILFGVDVSGLKNDRESEETSLSELAPEGYLIQYSLSPKASMTLERDLNQDALPTNEKEPTGPILSLIKKWLATCESEPVKARSSLKRRQSRVTKKEENVYIEDESITSGDLTEVTCLNHATIRTTGIHLLSDFGDAEELRVTSSPDHFQHLNFTKLTALRVLEIRECSFAEIVGLSTQLCTLCVQNCHLEQLHNLHLLSQLLCLDLSSNKLNRINGLEDCCQLIQLNLDNNDLLSIKGLDHLNQLVHFTCANNQLSSTPQLINSAALTTLRLSSNNLSKLPVLGNNVLLQELHLDNNYITSLAEFNTWFLPLLTALYLNSNSIKTLPEMKSFLSLETLELKENFVSSIDNLRGLSRNTLLKQIKVEGNPLQAIENYRSIAEVHTRFLVHLVNQYPGDEISKVLPNIEKVDDITINPKNVCAMPSRITAFFQKMSRHNLEIQKMSRHNLEIQNNTVGKKEDYNPKTLENLYSQLTRQLSKVKEFAKNLLGKDIALSSKLPKRTNSDKAGVEEEIARKVDSTVVGDLPGCREDGKSSPKKDKIHGRNCPRVDGNLSENVRLSDNYSERNSSSKSEKCTFVVNLKTCEYQEKYREAFKSNGENKDSMNASENMSVSQDLMQTSDNNMETTNDDSCESDFDYEQEVDLEEFNVDDVDQQWMFTYSRLSNRGCTSDTAPPPSGKEAWRRTPTENLQVVHKNIVPPTHKNVLPSHDDIRRDDTNTPNDEENGRGEDLSLSPVRKKEALSSEWGFNSDVTAELMIKRAKKMSGNKKKPDADERLRHFKRIKENYPRVKSKRSPPQRERASYFQGQKSVSPFQHVASWLDSVRVVHEEGVAADLVDKRAYREVERHASAPLILPRLGVSVLQGKPVQLVQSEIHNPKPPVQQRALSEERKARRR